MVDSPDYSEWVKPCHHWSAAHTCFASDGGIALKWSSGSTALDNSYETSCTYGFVKDAYSNWSPLLYKGVNDRIRSTFADKRLPTRIYIDRDPFSTDFSIWYVLVDLLDLPRMCRDLIPIMRHNRKRLQGADTRTKALTLKQISDLHLGYIFGVLPTKADIEGLVGAISRWSSISATAKKLDHTVLTWHKSLDLIKGLKLDQRATYKNAYNLFLPHSVPVSVDVFEYVDRLDFGRTMWYKVICPELIGWLNRLKQLADLFGVLDPAAVWDVIPFSFVVDWFLPFGDFLHRHRPRLNHCRINVIDYCEAIDYRSTLTHVARDLLSPDKFVDIEGSMPISPEKRDWEVMSTRVKVYHRERWHPPEHPILGSVPRKGQGLNMFRFFIAGSLLNQKIPRSAKPD